MSLARKLSGFNMNAIIKSGHFSGISLTCTSIIPVIFQYNFCLLHFGVTIELKRFDLPSMYRHYVRVGSLM